MPRAIVFLMLIMLTPLSHADPALPNGPTPAVPLPATVPTAPKSDPPKTGGPTADEQVFNLYQQTRHLPLDRFNRALDLLDDSQFAAIPANFANTHPGDPDLAVFAPYWSDQIAAAAALVASSSPEGGIIHFGEGPVRIAPGEFGQNPTFNDVLDAYARTRPDGIRPMIHDPTAALYDNGYYYVFATAERMPLFRSKDRLHWRHIGNAFTTAQQPSWWQDWQPANAKKDPKTGKLLSGDYNPDVFIWAPHLTYHNGQFHLYYAIPASFGLIRTAAIGHATKSTLDPAVPWIDDGTPVITCDDSDPFNTIDPNFIIDREGRAWMPFGSFAPAGINLVPLDPQTGRLLDGAAKPWTQIAGDGMESPVVWFDRPSDRYYLFASEGFGIGWPWDYKIRVYRTDPGAPITGPYVDQDGRRALDAVNRIGQGDKNDNPGLILVGPAGDRIAPGGQDVYRDNRDGKTYLVYHERDNSKWVGLDANGRGGLPLFNLQIREITFHGDGWPTLAPESLPTPDPTAAPRTPGPLRK